MANFPLTLPEALLQKLQASFKQFIPPSLAFRTHFKSFIKFSNFTFGHNMKTMRKSTCGGLSQFSRLFRDLSLTRLARNGIIYQKVQDLCEIWTFPPFFPCDIASHAWNFPANPLPSNQELLLTYTVFPKLPVCQAPLRLRIPLWFECWSGPIAFALSASYSHWLYRADMHTYVSGSE